MMGLRFSFKVGAIPVVNGAGRMVIFFTHLARHEVVDFMRAATLVACNAVPGKAWS